MAGREAARQSSPTERSTGEAEALEIPWSPLPTPATAELRKLRTAIREIAWRCAGVVRSEAGLSKGLERVPELESRLQGINPGTSAEVRLTEDLASAIFVLKAVLSASVSRRESRGSFQREDVPREDDVNWRKNSRVTYDLLSGKLAVSYHTVRKSEGGRCMREGCF
jgi:succinate dehydrogenase/fumarate reductase flavoprotein subunit